MPVNPSIKNAPDDVVQRLRERAAGNHRSLQGELMAIIEDAVKPAKYRTIDEVVAEVRERSDRWSGPRFIARRTS